MLAERGTSQHMPLVVQFDEKVQISESAHELTGRRVGAESIAEGRHVGFQIRPVLGLLVFLGEKAVCRNVQS